MRDLGGSDKLGGVVKINTIRRINPSGPLDGDGGGGTAAEMAS